MRWSAHSSRVCTSRASVESEVPKRFLALFDLASDLLHTLVGHHAGASGQDEHKFIAADACEGVRGSNMVVHLVDKAAKVVVTLLVAVGVVDVLEAVEIEVDYREQGVLFEQRADVLEGVDTGKRTGQLVVISTVAQDAQTAVGLSK